MAGLVKKFRLDLSIARNREQKRVTGRFLRVIESSSAAANVDCAVERIVADDLFINLTRNKAIKEGEGFNILYFSNAVQAGAWVDIIITQGEDDFDVLDPAEVTLEGNLTINNGADFNSDTVNIPVTAGGTLLIAANPNRRGLLITNTSTTGANLHLGKVGAVTTAQAFIPAGASLPVNTTAAIYALSSSGTIAVRYFEEIL